MPGAACQPAETLACRRISVDVFRHTLNLDLNFHLHRKTGEMTRIMDRGTSSMQVSLAVLQQAPIRLRSHSCHQPPGFHAFPLSPACQASMSPPCDQPAGLYAISQPQACFVPCTGLQPAGVWCCPACHPCRHQEHLTCQAACRPRATPLSINALLSCLCTWQQCASAAVLTSCLCCRVFSALWSSALALRYLTLQQPVPTWPLRCSPGLPSSFSSLWSGEPLIKQLWLSCWPALCPC